MDKDAAVVFRRVPTSAQVTQRNLDDGVTQQRDFNIQRCLYDPICHRL